MQSELLKVPAFLFLYHYNTRKSVTFYSQTVTDGTLTR